jgi:ribosomal protein L29
MKKKEVLKLSLAEAQVKLDSLYAEHLEFRFRKALGNAKVTPIYGRVLRRNIARLKTILGEYERGVRK